jgi:transposase
MDYDFRGTPEMREAVRSQIVAHGLSSSEAIAAALGVPHGVVVRMLRRFEAVGALALTGPTVAGGPVEVVPGSLSARFRDLAAPLW